MKAPQSKHKTVLHESKEECKEECKEEAQHFDSNRKLKERIQQKAYELCEGRGCLPGCELDDWLKAETFVESEFGAKVYSTSPNIPKLKHVT